METLLNRKSIWLRRINEHGKRQQLISNAPRFPFENIRKTSDDSNEYWSARELANVLGYTEYRKFKNTVQKAEIACENSGQKVADHFAHVSGMVG